MLDDESMEEKGAREKAAGENRQKKNDALSCTTQEGESQGFACDPEFS